MQETEDILTKDQTQFGVEEPLFEPVYRPAPPVPSQMDKSQKPVVWILAMVAGLVLLVVGVVAAVIMNQPEVIPKDSIEQKIDQRVVESNQWLLRVRDLRVKLDAGDPTRQGLAFPQVDMNIWLDDPKKR